MHLVGHSACRRAERLHAEAALHAPHARRACADLTICRFSDWHALTDSSSSSRCWELGRIEGLLLPVSLKYGSTVGQLSVTAPYTCKANPGGESSVAMRA